MVPSGDASFTARSAFDDSASAAPSLVEGVTLSATGKEAGTSSAVAIVHARGRDSVLPPEDECVGLISRDGGVDIGSTTGTGETLKRASPRIASTASPEHGRGHGGSVQNAAFQLGRAPDPRWQEGARIAAAASIRVVSSAAAAATKSFQAAADVVLVRRDEVGNFSDVITTDLSQPGSLCRDHDRLEPDEASLSSRTTLHALPSVDV